MVSAIIVNYHCHLLTLKAVSSLLADTPQAQVIVVDNSADPEESRRLREELPASVECLVTGKNLGFGKACNLGFSQARHEWIFLLNPDAFVLEGCIAALVDFLERFPRAGAAGPLVFWDEKQTWLLPPSQLPTPLTELGMTLALCWPWLGNRVSRNFRKWALECLGSGKPVAQRMLSGGHMLLRRSAITAAGGLFDPDFFMYFEDTDLCRRLQRAGFELYMVPAARAVHAWRAETEKSVLAQESRRQYFRKQFPGSLTFALREELGRCNLRHHPLESQDLGLCHTAPTILAPAAIKGSWVLEVSPHPLLVPSLYFFGQGHACYLSDEIWSRFGNGNYWARIAGPDGADSKMYHWQVVN